MATEDFVIATNIATENTEIDASAAFSAGDQYLTGGLVYSSSVGKFISSQDNIPVGIVRMWAKGDSNATPPEDYLVCAGQSVDVSSYPKLHSIIGYRFGGSGSSFNLPKFNLSTGLTYRVPSGVDSAELESDELNFQNLISIGDGNLLAHTHQISTFTYTTDVGNSANTSHSHANSNSNATGHGHTFANTSITSNASHSHNWGSANANHTHQYIDTGSANAATSNPLSNHAHNTGNTIGDHVHTINSSSHSHTFGNTSFNSTSNHSHAVTTNTSSETTSHVHAIDATATYFIIKYR